MLCWRYHSVTRRKKLSYQLKVSRKIQNLKFWRKICSRWRWILNVLEDAECFIFLHPNFSACELRSTFSAVGISYFNSGVLMCLSTMSETKQGHLCTRMFTWFIWQYFIWCRFDSVPAIKKYFCWSEMFMKHWCWPTVFFFFFIITSTELYFYFHSISVYDIMICNTTFKFLSTSPFVLYTVIKGKSLLVLWMLCCSLSDSKPEIGAQNRW